MDNYQVVVDNWEGRPGDTWDVARLKENGVVGMIVRLNDINGGHHMDTEFNDNWAIAQQFPVRTIYFVYNPWVDGKTNYEWMSAHLPNDVPTRLCYDVEVTKDGYLGTTYAAEVASFLNRAKNAGWKNTIYTGAWFLPILAYWPTDCDYWWAAYSTMLTQCTSWQAYKSVLSTLVYANWVKRSPGPARLWQATGDKCYLPGFGGKDVDIDIFPGALDELKAWMGMPEPVVEVPPPGLQEQIDALAKQLDALTGRVELLENPKIYTR